MNYSIQDISKKTGLTISTLRYYDKEGLFPNLERKESNYRVFTELELETLKIIACFIIVHDKGEINPFKQNRKYYDFYTDTFINNQQIK